MTKSVVRGMDAIQAFCKQKKFKSGKKFILAGASKRGWTTWTTAIVDSRVSGIIPIVIDLLNIQKSFERHFCAYGKWSPAINDYVDMHITDRKDSPEFTELVKLVEPYRHLDQLSMPKYMINTVGDEFFLPDSSQLYIDDLPGQSYLRYIPNRGHYIRHTDYLDNITAIPAGHF